MPELSRYQWYKSHNICPRCGHNRPAQSRVYCEECLEKCRKNQASRRQKQSYKNSKCNCYRQLIEERKKKNVCVRCGKIKFNDQKQYCDECLVKFRKWNKKSYERRKSNEN